ncbi:hypothetical protein [Gryllotalpicola protaetiae]|uniref:Uncharacterized protein n=1 Tax=Gryllotalpicola protaetiae TaxID=2419771 RepID=A0A387BFD4_9MICO|nr:hypothetical protein [Gryllotalpicola protaetiae]AYG02715.1 hypothetical protein D7I44_03725 [Gryllotalpicola protaetiae]
MHSPVRRRVVFVVIAVAVVFLGIEAIEAVVANQTLPSAVRFAALHSIGAIVFGALSIAAVIAAVVLEPRWLVILIGACIAAAAVALWFV